MFIVYDKNMNKKEFPEGVRPLDIFISSINKRRITNQVEGRDGVIDKGSTKGARSIEVSVGLFSNDTQDYRLLRDEIYGFFDDDEFYVAERFEKGKLYKVKTVQSYIPERINGYTASAQFSLEMVDLPYAESIGTSQDIQQNGIDAESELWGFGMGLIDEMSEFEYLPTTWYYVGGKKWSDI